MERFEKLEITTAAIVRKTNLRIIAPQQSVFSYLRLELCLTQGHGTGVFREFTIVRIACKKSF